MSATHSSPPAFPWWLRYRSMFAACGILAASVLLGCFVAIPPSAKVTQPLHVIGFLASRGPQPWHTYLADGMRALDYVEGQTFVVVPRYADGDAARLQPHAEELARVGAKVIVTADSAAVAAVQAAAPSLPIVMAVSGDAVGAGMVQSLARPGGNVTGLTWVTPELTTKRFEILREVLPSTSHVGALRDPGNASRAREWDGLLQSAGVLDIQISDLPVRGMDDIDRAFDAASATGLDAVYVVSDPRLAQQRARIHRMAALHKIPVMFERGELLDGGGLVSYGVPIGEMYRRSATFVDRILRGASPGDLPIEGPTRYELTINLSTANDFGLVVPPAVLLRADRVLP